MRATSPAPLSYAQLLRIPTVGRLLAATALARLAGRMFLLTLVLFALDRFGDPGLTGWLSAAAMGPGLAISPLAGALLDRIGAVQAIRLDMTLSAVLLFGLAGVTAARADTLTLLFGLVTVFSLTSPLSAAGIRTVLPRLIPADVLDRANALDTLIFGVTDIAGPAAAGLLTAAVGAPAAMLPIAALYAAASWCLRDLRAPTPAMAPRPLLRHAVEGLVIVARTPTLRGLVSSYVPYEICWGMLLVAVPVLVADHAGLGGPGRDQLTGMLWAGVGAAGIVGALLAGQWRTVRRERGMITIGTLITAAALGTLGASGSLAGLAAALAVLGAMAGPIDVSVLTLRQRRTPPDQLGRVLAVSISLNWSGQPIGSALAGWLLTWAPHAVLPVAAAAAAVSALACWAAIPSREA